MPRILLVAQDKGGSGKSTLTRALAECLPAARLIEIEANRRLIELEDRVSFFPVRAERGEINRTGGAAARAEFDGPLNAIAAAQGPVVVDVGANTAGSLLPLIGEAQARYARRGVEFALLVVLTSEPGALANAPVLLDLARPFTAARFVVENQVEGPVDPKALKAFTKDVTLTQLERLSLDERANELLQNVWPAPSASGSGSAGLSSLHKRIRPSGRAVGQDGDPRVLGLIKGSASCAIFAGRLPEHRSTVRPSSSHRSQTSEGRRPPRRPNSDQAATAVAS